MEVQSESLPESKLIEENIQFAEALARKFYRDRRNIGIDLEDYVGAAMLGLCDAAQRYCSERGGNFRTFSYFRIRGSMYDLLRRGGGISRTCFEDLTSGNGEDAAEEAERLPFSLAHQTQELVHLAVLIEEFGIRLHASGVTEGVDISYSDDIDPEVAVARKDLARYLDQLVEDLPERERLIIRQRYYEAQTFDEMRDLFDGVSKSWLSRLHNRALDRLRDRIEAEHYNCARRLASHAV